MAENLTFNLDVDSSRAVQSINTFFDTFDKGAAQAKSKLNTAFGQTIQTDIKVEFKNGQLVAKEVQTLKQESNRLATAYKAVNGELGKTPNALKQQRAVLKSLLGDTQKFKTGTKQVTAEWTTLTAKIKKTESALKNMGDGNGLSALTSRFIGIQTAANLATAGIMSIVRGIGDLSQTAFRMETLSLQMEAFVGSAAGAEKAFDQFVEIAANSPLDLEQVAGAGKIMMAFGMSTEDAIKATEQLALVSAATGGDINLLARNMGQIVAQGRAYTRDLTQFAIQGIPIWNQLSVATGKNVTELKAMAAEGRITGTEVSQALDLMTQKGTAFYEVGERMKETFAGRFAAIQAATQNMAREFIDAFNIIDRSLGGPVSNSMKGFAEAIGFIAEHFGTIGAAAAAASIGLGTFFTLMAVGKIAAIVTSVGGIASAFGLIKGSIMTALAAQLALMGSMGPLAWAGVVTGLAAAGVAYGVIKGKIDETQTGQTELTGEIANTGKATGELTEEQIKYAEKAGNREAVEAYEEQQKKVSAVNQELTRAVEILKEQQTARNEAFAEEQSQIQTLIEAERDKVSKAKQARDEAKQAVDEKYNAEKAHLDETLSLVRQRYDEEISRLREKTPSEQALYNLEKEKLQKKIQQGGLDKEEMLRLNARLERMNANEKIQQLITQKKGEEKAITAEIDQLEADRKNQLRDIKKEYEQLASTATREIAAQKKALSESKAAQKDFNSEIKESIKNSNSLTTSIGKSAGATRQVQGEVRALTIDLRNATRQAIALAAAIRRKNAAARSSASSSGTGIETKTGTTGGGTLPKNFAGGQIGAGTTSWVNELGKEAFLSASGKLSMINDRGGQWTAPTDGTIIPAHLTKRLDIPNGGVNINNSSGVSAAARGGGMNMSSMVKAIAGALGGDTVNNSVTIQSSNPTQSANNMLVQLQKVRRTNLRR